MKLNPLQAIHIRTAPTCLTVQITHYFKTLHTLSFESVSIIYLIISEPKHILWVLKRTITMSRLSSADILCKLFGLNQAQHFIGPDLKSYFLILMLSLKEFASKEGLF